MTNYSTSGSGVNGTLRHFDREKLIWDAPFNVNQKITLLALNSFVDGDGKCWPGQARLAGMTGLTDRTIRNVCSSLEAYEFDGKTLQILERIARYKDGHRTSSIYKVNFHLIPQPEPDSGMKKQPEPDSGMKGVIPEPDSGKQPERGSDDLSSLDLPSKNDLSSPPTPQGGTGQGQGSDEPKRKRNGKPTAQEIYGQITDLARFERFWSWYTKEFCSVTEHSGGSKSEAGAAWLKLEQTNYFGVGVEGFNAGVLAQLKKRPVSGVGIKHACRFLAGGEKGEPDWLVDWLAMTKEQVSPTAFLDDLRSASPTPHLHPTGEDPARLEEEILAEHRRLYEQGGVIISESGCRRFGVTTVYDIIKRPTEAIAYLTWLKSQPTPQDDSWAL